MWLRATATTPTLRAQTPPCQIHRTWFSAVEIDDTNRAPEFLDQDLKMDGDQTDQEREIAENTGAGEAIGGGQTVR